MVRDLPYYLRAACRLVYLGLLALLLVRVEFGPVKGIISARSTLNIAAFTFLALVGFALFARSNDMRVLESAIPGKRIWRWPLLAAILAPIPFLFALNAPFLFDDYVHLATAAQESWQAVVYRSFVDHPIGGDGFFRPLGNLYFWLNFRRAGWSAEAWHTCSLAIHIANTLLLRVFLRRIGCSLAASFFGTLFFAWHASNVEAVCWTAASFDLLAAFFSLIVLTMVVSPQVSRMKILPIMFVGALACLSKESAYCLPLLAASLAFFKREGRGRMLRNSACLAIACAAVFVLRIWYLQGIGGYRTAGGNPMVLSFHFVSVSQALLLRLWAVLFFPVNWSTSAELWLGISAALMLVSLASVVFYMRASARGISAALLFTLCAALPVFPILLIGSDLAGARVLYLPSIGISLLWTQIFAAGAGRKTIVGSLGVSVLLFQLTALLHNELIWKHEATVAHQACFDTAVLLTSYPGSKVYAASLPKIRRGVYSLANGFPQCVSAASGGQVDPSRVNSGTAGPHDFVLQWDDAAGRLVMPK